MPVPNTFANATTSIPLSQLDQNFATAITLGNTAIQLGNTVTTLNNMTLANVTVSSGNVTVTSLSGAFNGTVGATTPNTGAFTTITSSVDINVSQSNAGNFYGVLTRNTNTGTAASNGFAVGNNASAYGLTLTLNSGNYTGAANYAYLLNQFNAPLILGANGTGVATVSSTGLAVTGTLSSTDTISANKNVNTDFLGCRLLNQNTGTSAQAGISLTNSAGVDRAAFQLTGGSYVSVITWDRQDCAYVQNEGTGGISLAARGASAPITFHTGGDAEKMRLTSSGDLLLGTTTGGVGGGLTIVSTKYIYSLGTYNNTTASAANMFVDAAAGVFARSTSALKYKQDIRDLEEIDINKFRPVRYRSKCENDDQSKDHIGIIADEVHDAGITELVSYGADGEVEGFQYDRLTAVLVKTVQKLSAQIQELNAKVAVLEAKLEAAK